MTANNFSKIKILYVGNGGVGSNSLSLFTGFQSNVNRSVLVDTKFFDSPTRLSFRRIFLYFFPKYYGFIFSQLKTLKYLVFSFHFTQ